MRVFRGFHQPALSATVLTLGNFDGMHRGHRALLARLLEKGGALAATAAVVTFEPHPREFFTPDCAPARLSTLREKLEAFSEAGVDAVYVTPFSAAFAAQPAEAFVENLLCRRLKARHVIVGDDFRFGAERLGDFAYLQAAGRALGFGVEAVPTVTLLGERVSSSAVRTALAAGELAKAADFLGRPYAIAGQVVHGQKLGRQLGFATANIRIRHNPLPMQGVFVVAASGVNERSFFGVANLGLRPTLNPDGACATRPLLEVHLLDFSGNLYGAHLNIAFLHKLRDEMTFSHLDALKTRIAADVRAARDFLAASS
ncbi:MAG: bifunctional riboflavin kinase/FAD synthetase [Zoogloeaceae bacterium]|jgi:riboflavin kinase/FMN adenylyltransferase|nr:bifunctional riboflavin kinase/FAD synthetase [Zoogloeaceae bacterium]